MELEDAEHQSFAYKDTAGFGFSTNIQAVTKLGQFFGVVSDNAFVSFGIDLQ